MNSKEEKLSLRNDRPACAQSCGKTFSNQPAGVDQRDDTNNHSDVVDEIPRLGSDRPLQLADSEGCSQLGYFTSS